MPAYPELKKFLAAFLFLDFTVLYVASTLSTEAHLFASHPQLPYSLWKILLLVLALNYCLLYHVVTQRSSLWELSPSKKALSIALSMTGFGEFLSLMHCCASLLARLHEGDTRLLLPGFGLVLAILFGLASLFVSGSIVAGLVVPPAVNTPPSDVELGDLGSKTNENTDADARGESSVPLTSDIES